MRKTEDHILKIDKIQKIFSAQKNSSDLLTQKAKKLDNDLNLMISDLEKLAKAQEAEEVFNKILEELRTQREINSMSLERLQLSHATIDPILNDLREISDGNTLNYKEVKNALDNMNVGVFRRKDQKITQEDQQNIDIEKLFNHIDNIPTKIGKSLTDIHQIEEQQIEAFKNLQGLIDQAITKKNYSEIEQEFTSLAEQGAFKIDPQKQAISHNKADDQLNALLTENKLKEAEYKNLPEKSLEDHILTQKQVFGTKLSAALNEGNISSTEIIKALEIIEKILSHSLQQNGTSVFRDILGKNYKVDTSIKLNSPELNNEFIQETTKSRNPIKRLVNKIYGNNKQRQNQQDKSPEIELQAVMPTIRLNNLEQQIAANKTGKIEDIQTSGLSKDELKTYQSIKPLLGIISEFVAQSSDHIVEKSGPNQKFNLENIPQEKQENSHLQSR